VELRGTHIYNFDYNSSAGNSLTSQVFGKKATITSQVAGAHLLLRQEFVGSQAALKIHLSQILTCRIGDYAGVETTGICIVTSLAPATFVLSLL
jgi:hypothetical protein